MTDESPPRARKRPKQSRSASLVAAIQQACQQILEQEGAEKLTTQRIADVAGVTIGSLYQYFPNKEAVVADVFESEMARDAEETIIATRDLKALRQGSLEEIVSTVVELEVDLLLKYYDLNPEFYQQYQQAFDIHKRIDQLTEKYKQPPMDEWFTSVLSRHAGEHHIENPEMTSFIALRALEGVLKTTANERPTLLRDKSFKKELCTLLLSYLQPAHPKTGQ